MTNVTKLGTQSEGPTFLDYLAHPLANTFPMITGTAMEELQDNVRRNGILEPIRLYQGMILDGRNRYAAAKAVGHSFSAKDFKEWTGTLAEAEAYVISTNLHRRQLSNAQKQEVIQRMIAKNPTLGDREIARMCGVSHTTVAAARDRLAHSPEVRRYEAFKKDWKKLSDEQCAAFVKDHAADLRFLLAEVGDNLASQIAKRDRALRLVELYKKRVAENVTRFFQSHDAIAAPLAAVLASEALLGPKNEVK